MASLFALSEVCREQRLIDELRGTIESQQETIQNQRLMLHFWHQAITWFKAELQRQEQGTAAQDPAAGSESNPIDVDNKERLDLWYWEMHKQLKDRHYGLIEAMSRCPPPLDMPKKAAEKCQSAVLRMLKQLEETPGTHQHGPYSGLEEIESMINNFAGREPKVAADLTKALDDVLKMVGEDRLAHAARQIAALPDAKPQWSGLKLTVDTLKRDRELLVAMGRVLEKDLSHPRATSEEKRLWQAIMKRLAPLARPVNKRHSVDLTDTTTRATAFKGVKKMKKK